MNSQKKNGTEKKSGNSKSTKNKTSQVKTGDQYVVDGAIFKCQYGSAPSQILVANNQNVMVQGKAMVVDKDTNFQIATSPFATCTQNKNPQSPICLYAKGQWNKQTTVEQGGQNALTESSTMTCSIFAGEISCVFPGQIKNVSVADFEKTKIQTLSNFPLALVVTFPDFGKDKIEQKTKNVKSVSVSKNTVRIDEQIILHAYSQENHKGELTYPNFKNWVFFTTKELKEDKENKIKKGTYIDDIKIFKHVSSPFIIKLHKPGKYHIEACGDRTLEKYEKLDPNNPLKTENNKTTPPFYKDCEEVVDVVEQNRITRILKDGKETTDSIINVKQGATTVFSPKFLLDFDSNFEDLSCTVEKGNRESVDEGDYSFDVDKKTLSLTPSAAEVNYKITFYLHKKTDEGAAVKPFNEKSISVRSYNEAVLFAYVPTSAGKEKPTNNVTLKRPQEGLAFTVKLKDNKKGGDFSQVEWRLKKDDIYVDEPFKTKGETALYFFKEEGKYEIEADLTNTSYCNGGVTGTGVQKTSGNITQKIISHKFEISNNYVTGITISSNNGRRYVGVKYHIDPKFLFGDGTFATEKNSVEYNANGADKDCLREGIFRVDKPGEYKIVATLNGKSFESQVFKIEEAEIKKWGFCDVNNKKIDKIGRNNKFGINASVPAWGATEENSKRTVNVSLYCQKKELCTFKTELDKDGNFHVDNIDVEKDIFEKVANKNISHDGDKDLILTFVVFDSPSRIVKNLSRTERMGLFSTRTNLCVKSIPFVDGYFAEANGKRLVKMLTYNDKANARLQVLNYSDAKLKNLKFRLYENKRGLDPVVFENKEYIKPNESGIVEIPMPIGEDGVKEENHGDSKLPRLFYFKVFEKCKSHSTLMLDFHSTETLRRVCSYPKTFAEYDYDVCKETSAVQDEVLNELSAETAGKKYESEKLKEVRSYYHQMKIASPKDEAKEYVNSYNSLAPVVVGEEWEKEEREEKHVNSKCFCHRDFTVEEVKKIITELRSAFGSPAFKNDEIWEKSPYVNNKSIASFTYELNVAIKRYGINRCIQKIVFLAMACVETAFFRASEEGPNDYASSKSKFKGRGLLHMTHEGHYKTYNGRLLKNVLESPNLISDDIHNIVDSGATFFTNRSFMHNRVVLNNSKVVNKYQECFSVPYMLTLSQLCLFMESVPTKEMDYYLLINRLLNNPSKETPLSWEARQKAFETLKKTFNYKKEVCKEVEKDFPMHNTGWHDPLDVMQICAYSLNGHRKPYNASFHYRGTRPHQGVDLFAKLNTPIYACLDGRIVSASSVGDYGNMIVLAIYEESQVQIFKNRRKKDFEPYFPDEYSDGPGFNKDSDFFYLAYAHLSSFCVIEGDEVKAGDIIGYSGETGNAKGTKGPHVHFEVRSAQSCGTGMNNRCNPSLYFDYEQYTPIANRDNNIIKVVSDTSFDKYNKDVKEIEIRNIDGSVSTIDKKDFEVDTNDQYCYKRDKK